jgi:pseudaminic acid cytidylyltransferase
MGALCVIPARGGSKRIPRKNIRPFLGKPIIAYVIQSAIEAQAFEEVMVSTDDKEISEISRKYGAEVPFFRSKVTSGDMIGLAEVLIEVLSSYGKIGKVFDQVCCILPTSPLLSSARIKDSVGKLNKSNEIDAVVSVCQYDSPIQRAMKINKQEELAMIWPENRLVRTQDLEPSYHDAGQIYTIRTEVLKETRSLFPPRSMAEILSSNLVQDIDNESDWVLAEIKYRILNVKKKD